MAKKGVLRGESMEKELCKGTKKCGLRKGKSKPSSRKQGEEKDGIGTNSHQWLRGRLNITTGKKAFGGGVGVRNRVTTEW